MALQRAAQRGVRVRMILDRAALDRTEALGHFERAGVQILVDDKVTIAHNKVMVID
jgi:phosphatidylserine/phosphatidylglycerophosphate/cardiolipin synthase-like enzyme